MSAGSSPAKLSIKNECNDGVGDIDDDDDDDDDESLMMMMSMMMMMMMMMMIMMMMMMMMVMMMMMMNPGHTSRASHRSESSQAFPRVRSRRA